jgi:hypothetical protein
MLAILPKCRPEIATAYPTKGPGACSIKHWGVINYGLRNKLVCLFVQASVYLSKPKVKSLL